MTPAIPRPVLALAAAAALGVAAGCGDEEPPPAAGTATAATTTATATATAPSRFAVYFADAEGRLAAEAREGDASLRGVLEALAEGPRDAALIPALPAGTRVLDAALEGGVARVDLSEEFESGYPAGGAAAELAVVGPLVHTAAQVPAVESVLVTVEGRTPAPTGTQLDFSRPISPADVPLEHAP